jgi:putative ABC transport system permease protein
MWYAVNTLYRETSRFGPAIIAVAACAMLLMVQISMFLSALNYIAKPMAYADADLWIGHGDTASFEESRPIPRRWITRAASDPEVAQIEYYLMGTALLRKAGGGSELCTVMGVSMDDGSLGAGRIIPPWLREKLRSPGAVAANSSELARFGFGQPGYAGEVSGHSVYYVGYVRDFKRFTAPYLFCSPETARQLLPTLNPQETTYIVARCTKPGDAPAVAARLRQKYAGMAVYTRPEFIRTTQYHWFTRTKSGLMLFFVTVISSLVSLFITSQTLYAATAAARHEYAVLDAMGIPRRRIAVAVLWQSLWIGFIAAILGTPASYIVTTLLDIAGVPARFEPWLVAVGGVLTITTAPISGLISLRSLQLIEPAELLH